MSQDIFNTINPATTSGTQLASLLVAFKDAIISSMSGTSRPTEIDEGGLWVDTTHDGDDYWEFKMFLGGSTDVTLFRINLTSGTTTITGTSDSFDVSHFSDDAVGPLARLIKRRVATGGQVNSGDVMGEIQWMGRDNAAGNPIVARMKAVSQNNMTATAQGAYVVIEAITKDTATLVEIARFVDGKLGIGLTTPSSAIHVRSLTGIRSARHTDDAVGAQFIARKARLAGTTAVASADVIGQFDMNSTDDAATEFTGAQVVGSASEAHTSSARGTKLALKATKNGATSAVSFMEFNDVIESKEVHLLNALRQAQQDVATTASITALNADKCIVNFTGSTATALKGIDATGKTRVVLLHNSSSADITVTSEDAGATSTNRFTLPLASLTIASKESVEFFYNSVNTRWELKSGSSGGGGALVITSVQTLTGGGTVAISLVNQRQMLHVQGTTSQTVLSTTPFGSSAPRDGAELVLIGNDDTASVVVTKNDAAKGIVGNIGDTLELGKYSMLKLIYSASLDRYIANVPA